ncbi:hypothetical protein OZN62_10605 [Aurantiacibacter sp. MUD11]|uniref:hypothetical protein n=1 Tax=Aurantiacibacter sp. MUD11 TaxID=3003265 RepID=UPI0022AA27AC|nr:hypothetical protein [Aurantiacibacter sp. MUD11]WAT17372.1 hypothetical protein OZN62_10605 [Aurantiacibacter sp. MUD11]
MTADPRDTISEITEIEDGFVSAHLAATCVSVVWAALAGSIVMTAVLVAGASQSLPTVLGAMFGGLMFTMIFALLFASIGMLAIGLPVTLALRFMRLESVAAYTVLGTITGAGMLLLLFGNPHIAGWQDLLFPAAGALSGAVGAYKWGQFRLRFTGEDQRRLSAERPENPFHEMIH